MSLRDRAWLEVPARQATFVLRRCGRALNRVTRCADTEKDTWSVGWTGVFRGQRNGAHAAMPWPSATAEGVAASPVLSQLLRVGGADGSAAQAQGRRRGHSTTGLKTMPVRGLGWKWVLFGGMRLRSCAQLDICDTVIGRSSNVASAPPSVTARTASCQSCR